MPTLFHPRARIPRNQRTLLHKMHSVLSFAMIGFCLVYIGILGSIVSLQDGTSIQSGPTYATAILVDTSLSMSSKDVLPNRYNQALSIASGLIQSFPGTYTIIPFGSTPLVRVPWSEDVKGMSTILSHSTLGSYYTSEAYMGSAGGNAVALARQLLERYPDKQKSILFLGDGNVNTGYSISSFIPFLQHDGIRLFVCAIGQSGSILGSNYADKPITNSFDVAYLDSITKPTNGKWRVCNDTKESIDRLIPMLRGKDLLSHNTATREGSLEVWNDPSRRTLAYISIAYLILTSAGTYVIYLIQAPKK